MSKRSAQNRAEEGRAADQALLARRLAGLGLRGVERVALHRNRTVMVSLSGGVLRMHHGYAYAPDRVLEAVVMFLGPRVPRADRRRAEDTLLEFPVDRFVGGPRDAQSRHQGSRAADRRVLAELRALHRRLNAQFFGGRLSAIPFRVSHRMRTQLGEVTLDEATGRAVEIGLSRRHLQRDGWDEVTKTVLHEMIHQWQAESGLPVDHGATFRRKAREAGIEPAARRDVHPLPALDGFLPMEE